MACLVALLMLAPAVAGASGTYSVMTDAAKESKLLDIIEAFVPRVESKWVADATGKHPDGSNPSCTIDNITQTNGSFDACGDGVDQFRGLSSVAYDYATLLAGRPAASTLGGVSRATLVTHLEQTLLQLAYTNKLNKVGGWGGIGQGGIGAFEMGWALYTVTHDGVAGDQPAGTTITAVDAVVKSETNIAAGASPTSGTAGDSHAEDNVWEAMILATGAAMYPTDPSINTWKSSAKSFAVNSQVIPADDTSGTLVDGVALSTWTGGTISHIFESDYTMINHSFFHPLYSEGVMSSLMDLMLEYQAAGLTLPQAFTFRQQTLWDQLLGPFYMDDGDLFMPGGTDWQSHDYQFIPYLSGMATYGQNDDASVLESRAITKLAERQSDNGNGSLYDLPRIGYEADALRNVAQAYQLHVNFTSSPTPSESTFDTAFHALDGTRQFASENTVFNRTPNATVGMYWTYVAGHAYPTAFIIPSVHDQLDDPVLGQWWAGSGVNGSIGTVNWSCDCNTVPGYLSTAGTIGARHFSLTSYDDGSTIMLDQGDGEAFTMPFENDSALWTGSNTRPVYYEAGSGTGSLSGSWANVADRYGMVVKGGSGIRVDTFADTQPGKADISNAQFLLNGSSGGTGQNRAALVLPNSDSNATADVNADALQATTSDASWAAMTARVPDNTARIAVASWSGAGSATVSNMTSQWGVPIPDHNADITVNNVTSGHSTGSFSVTLGNPASIGWKGFFYVDSNAGSGSVTVHPLSATEVRVTNGGTPTTVTVRYADGSGTVHASQLALAANAVAYASADTNNSETEGLRFAVGYATSSAASHGPELAIDPSTSTYWSSTGGPSQDYWVDYGKQVDLGGVTMTPVASNGPKNYLVQTSSNANCADGVSGYTTAATVTGAASSGGTTTTFASAASARCVLIHTTVSWGSLVEIGDLALTKPSIDIDLVDPRPDGTGSAQVRLARSGWNTVTVRIRNNGAGTPTITLGTSGLPTGVTANTPSAAVPSGSFVDVQLNLTASGTAATSGTSNITVTGTSAASETLTLAQTDDLALNDKGTTFPLAASSSEDPAWIYPASLAFDGNTSGSGNFFVTGPFNLATSPQDLTLDFGSSISVKRFVMTPRASTYGPKDYTIQTSTNSACASGTGFSTAAGGTVTGASATVATSTTLTSAVSARCVRLHITAAQGAGGIAQAQVRELQVYPS